MQQFSKRYRRNPYNSIAALFFVAFFFSCNSHVNNSKPSTNDAFAQDTIKIQKWVETGQEFLNNHPDSCIFYYKQAYNLAKNIDNSFYIGISSYRLGTYYNHILDINSAKRYLYLSIKYLSGQDATNNQRKIAWVYYSLAQSYQEENNYDSLLYCAGKSDTLAQLAKDSSLTHSILDLLATSYYYRHDFEKAIKYATTSFYNDSLKNDTIGLINDYFFLGVIYLQMEKDTPALYNFEKCLHYEEAKEQSGRINELCATMAIGYMRLQNFKKAFEYLQKAKTYTLPPFNVTPTTNYYTSWSVYYMYTFDYVNARKEALENVNIQKDNGSRLSLSMAIKILWRVDSAAGNFKNALNEIIEARALNMNNEKPDSIIRIAQEIDSLKNKLIDENNKKIFEISSALNEEKLTRLKQGNLFYLTIMLGLGLAAASLTIYTIRRKKLIVDLRRNKEIVEKQNRVLQQNISDINSFKQLLENDLDQFKELAARRLMNPQFLFNSLHSIHTCLLISTKQYCSPCRVIKKLIYLAKRLQLRNLKK